MNKGQLNVKLRYYRAAGIAAYAASAPPPRCNLLDVFAHLAPSAGAHGVGAGVFGFLTTRDAPALRRVCRLCCADVAAARWLDVKTRIDGSLAAWRACFPGARAANVEGRTDLADADFAHLAGVKKLDMGWCAQVTDAGLAHLTGIHTLYMRDCIGITDAGLEHLRGTHSLSMLGCTGTTDAGLAHLRGVHTLDISYCTGFTDAGLAHLQGIQTLDISRCAGLTDAGLTHLHGVHSLNMQGCTRVSDAGLDSTRALSTSAASTH